MNPIILFRGGYERDEEKLIAEKYFPVTDSRIRIQGSHTGFDDCVVIGRYSVLPFYEELERDLRMQGARLINSNLEHQYIANMDYYEDLKEFTAETWFRLDQVPKDSGPWVLKGRTNSRKLQWATHMKAETWEDLVRIYIELSNDPLLGQQGIVIRKFLDFEIVEEGISQPFFNEWRFFVYKGEILSYGWYWSSAEKVGTLDAAGIALVLKIAKIIRDKVPFAVIDIGKLATGEWKLIELNDGQMSGLSENLPEILYQNLAKALEKETFLVGL